ncbi:MAG: pyruvate kinase [Acidimicrobiia bacterium]|nr:pyruvate kinase [Acidimicrobiia bacterium]MDH3397933.1 pyruvate kinase [Acidimicrobiia bacterium]MDH5615950.1 pyruvate kinase [Acidimicrobiia bacterium]
MTRHTKIIATMGPAISSAETVDALVGAGMDVARLNFSHGTYDDHGRYAGWVREAAAAASRPIGLLQDIQGPKIRTGTFPGGAFELTPGDQVLVRKGKGMANPGEILVDYEYLLEDVGIGDLIVLADGLLRLEVIGKDDGGLMAEAVQPGVLIDRKGVAFPRSKLRVGAITDKDRRDLEFGRNLGVDFVAASFVQSAAEIEEIAELAGGSTPIIAKIELAAAYENLDAILDVAQGAMVARGDLGVQLPLETIPAVQRDILARTNRAGIVSITATEMLESMTNSIRPTRAEVTDVTNAVLNGTDAVMLSGETAIGKYPVQTVEVMNTICREAEKSPASRVEASAAFMARHLTFASATAKAAVEAATDLDLHTIVAFTESGNTALLLSKYRPTAQIMAFTPEPSTLRRMALYWGVIPNSFVRLDHTDVIISAAEEALLRMGTCDLGEGVVMVAGIPPNQRSSTNLMKLHTIGDATLDEKDGH